MSRYTHPLARLGFLIGVRQHAWIFRVGVAGRNRHAEILSCFMSFSFLFRSVQRDSLLEERSEIMKPDKP